MIIFPEVFRKIERRLKIEDQAISKDRPAKQCERPGKQWHNGSGEVRRSRVDSGFRTKREVAAAGRRTGPLSCSVVRRRRPVEPVCKKKKYPSQVEFARVGTNQRKKKHRPRFVAFARG